MSSRRRECSAGLSLVAVAGGLRVVDELRLRRLSQIEREVKTGRFSTDYVEVSDGVAEGEQVLLDRSAA